MDIALWCFLMSPRIQKEAGNSEYTPESMTMNKIVKKGVREFSHQCNVLFHIGPSGAERSSVISVHPPLNLISCPPASTHKQASCMLVSVCDTQIGCLLDSRVPVTLRFQAAVAKTLWMTVWWVRLDWPLSAESARGPPRPPSHYCSEFV